MEKSGRIRKDTSGIMMNESCKRIANGLRTYVPFNKGIYCSVMLILFISTFLSLFISSTLPAREDKGVVILNSDMSIYKYSLVQSEIKSKITNLKGEIDLGSKWIMKKRYILVLLLGKFTRILRSTTNHLIISWRPTG